MHIQVDVATHVGSVREVNEDCAVVGTAIVQSNDATAHFSTHDVQVVAILDGIGGHGDGAIASWEAARQIATDAANSQNDAYTIIQRANQAVFDAASNGRGNPLMGSTIVLMVIESSGVTIANVGDSPGYELNGGYLVEHTVPDKSITSALTASLGGTASYEPVEPHIHRLDRNEHQTNYLLCSDGLSDVVSVSDIESIVQQDENSAGQLVQAALQNGGPDNVTVARVRVISDDPLRENDQHNRPDLRS